MAWTTPFYRKTPSTRDAYGYRFEITDRHLTPEQCQPLKFTFDSLGEQVLDRLNELSPPISKDLPRNNTQQQAPVSKDGTFSTEEHEPPPPPTRDLWEILKQHKDSDELLQRFWKEIHTIPPWIDWDQIARGQEVFYRYGGACMTGLAYQSLLGGMGAARVVEVLARTGGFSTKVARRRLFETTQHILQCTKSLESMQPGGDGFISTVRVRLLHAAVRQRIMNLSSKRAGYYDVQAWGVPINDLDAMGTIVTFSASLIWVSLPRQGIILRRQEKADYVALWRYIAYVIGSPTDQFETPEQAKRLMESLMLYEIHPTPTSKILANNVIKSLEGQPPGFASADFLIASARWMNGNKLIDELGLPRPSIYYWLLMAGQCIFFFFWSYINRSVPSWDRRKIEMLRKVLYSLTVDSKFGLEGKPTTFAFVHIPEYSTITEMGECAKEAPASFHVERRNLKTLLVTLGIMSAGAWVAFKIGGSIVRSVW